MKTRELERYSYKLLMKEVRKKLIDKGYNGLKLEEMYTHIINEDISIAITFILQD